MKNLSWAPGGFFVNTALNGSQTSTPVAKAHVVRSQTGYIGVRSKVQPRPMHAYSLTVYDLSSNREMLTQDWSNGMHKSSRGSGSVLFAAVSPFNYQPTPNFDHVYNEAVAKLGEKLRGGLDVSVDLAEANKTRKMLKVTDTVLDLVKTATKRFGTLKALGNAWLTNQYGIQPLLKTIYGLAEENIRVVINSTEHYSVRSTVKYTPTSLLVPAYWGNIVVPVTEADMKMSVTLGVNMRTPQAEETLRRFTSLNPASIAWELTPYSFVADWFYNVGGYLRSLETQALYHNDYISGYRTNLLAGTAQSYQRSVSTTPTSSSIVTTDFFVNSLNIERSVIGAYPFPAYPVLRAGLGSSRLLSAASLLAGFLGKRQQRLS